MFLSCFYDVFKRFLFALLYKLGQLLHGKRSSIREPLLLLSGALFSLTVALCNWIKYFDSVSSCSTYRQTRGGDDRQHPRMHWPLHQYTGCVVCYELWSIAKWKEPFAISRHRNKKKWSLEKESALESIDYCQQITPESKVLTDRPSSPRRIHVAVDIQVGLSAVDQDRIDSTLGAWVGFLYLPAIHGIYTYCKSLDTVA